MWLYNLLFYNRICFPIVIIWKKGKLTNNIFYKCIETHSIKSNLNTIRLCQRKFVFVKWNKRIIIDMYASKNLGKLIFDKQIEHSLSDKNIRNLVT